jgi:hypothetical protein
MMRRVLVAFFAAVVLAGFAAASGAGPVSADGENITITPWRAEQTVYRTIEGSNFAPNTPIRLYVTDPAHTPWWEIANDGLMTGPDGSIWFQILPSGFAYGDLTNGVWQLRVCANACYDLTMFIGGSAPMVPTGLPARLCTPFVTPFANFPTFGPPGYAIDPRSGYTFNDIVQYCGPYATPWTSWDTFLVPANWYPGYTLPYWWPYQTVYPWNYYTWDQSWGPYPGYSGPMFVPGGYPSPTGTTSGFQQILP